MNENLNLLVEEGQSRLTVKDEVMQNALINERANVDVKMQDDDCMILSASSILVSELRN